MGRDERPAEAGPPHLRYMYSEISARFAVYSYAWIESEAASPDGASIREKGGTAAKSREPPASATRECPKNLRLDPCRSSAMAVFRSSYNLRRSSAARMATRVSCAG